MGSPEGSFFGRTGGLGVSPKKGFLCHCEESFFRKDDEAISGLGEMNGD
jgi:hypothetical protein